MKPKFSQPIFEKYWNAEFHENRSSGARANPRGRKAGRMYRQTNTGKLKVASCECA